MKLILLSAFFLINTSYQDQNHSIQNDFFKVESEWNLTENTKKKNIYEVTFRVINKTGVNIYYVSTFSKSNTKVESSSLQQNNFETNNTDDMAGNAPPPVSSSAYVDSGGAMKVGTGSSQRGAGRKTSDNIEVNQKNEISAIETENFEFNNSVFEINFGNSKNLKIIPNPSNNPEKSFYFNNKGEGKQPIKFSNLTDNKVQSSNSPSNYDPIVCIIPKDGLEKKSIFEINKKSGQKPGDFFLTFSKDIAYSNNTKLLLDKTYHNSIEEAIKKYLELQSILDNNF